MKRTKKGFTLAELLVVIAIIAVLVAIAIPTFTAQLERARQAADLANIRAAYAEAAVEAMDPEDDGTGVVSEPMTQHDGDWGQVEWPDYLGDAPAVTAGKTVTVVVDPDTGDAVCTPAT